MNEPKLTEAQRDALDFALFEGASMDGATAEAILDRLDPTVASMVADAEQTARVTARAEVIGWLHDHAKGRPHPQEDYIRAVLDKARAALGVDVQAARAEALRDAADAWQQGQWADAPRRADRVEERIANAQFVTAWLRKRAEAAS